MITGGPPPLASSAAAAAARARAASEGELLLERIVAVEAPQRRVVALGRQVAADPPVARPQGCPGVADDGSDGRVVEAPCPLAHERVARRVGAPRLVLRDVRRALQRPYLWADMQR
eukprot:scaffold115762_cov60-Phaeocystis_antarctica.AAC.1